MAGLLDMFGLGGGDDIKAAQVQVNPETDRRISAFTNDASQSQAGMAKDINANTNVQANMADQARRDKQLYGVENGMGDAINSRYNTLLKQNLSQLKQQGDLKAYEQKAQMLGSASQIANARQQITTQNYERLMKAYTANEQARAQALGSILKVGGMVVGAMYGGPAGAAAGGAVGGALAGSASGGTTSSVSNSEAQGFMES